MSGRKLLCLLFVKNRFGNRVKRYKVFPFCLFLDNNGSITILSNMPPFQQFNIAPSHSRITTEKEGFPYLLVETRCFQKL